MDKLGAMLARYLIIQSLKEAKRYHKDLDLDNPHSVRNLVEALIDLRSSLDKRTTAMRKDNDDTNT